MDSGILFEAAREGNIEVFTRVLQDNPSILADSRLTSLGESVLHVATKLGNLNFVNEVMKIDGDIGCEMNKDGFRALDIAVIMGNLAIVRNILSYDRELGRLRGKDNRIALHYAAAKGRVKIIYELLTTFPDCLQDITVHGETALHLAVKNYQFEAFVELVKWVERLSKEAVINIQDGDGNTVLHLAVATKQYACLNLLLDEERGRIEVNVRNGNGLTALDISDIVMQDCYDAKIGAALQHAGAERAQIITQHSPAVVDTNPQQSIQINQDHLQSQPASRDWSEFFKFEMDRDSPSDARNVMLLVAALIATVSFQAAVSPPSNLFDMSHILNSTIQPLGVSAFADDFIFLFFNTLGLCASIHVIAFLTLGFPLFRYLYISLLSLGFTYGASFGLVVRGSKVDASVKALAYLIPFAAFLITVFLGCLPRLSCGGT